MKTKRWLSILLSLALMFSLSPVSVLATGGTLTKDGDYYEIYDAADLKAFAALVNGGETSANGKLMNSITLSDVCGESIGDWTPIGNFSSSYHQFAGTFDGQGYTIADLYIKNSSSRQGLFGYVDSGGTVKNVTVIGTVTGYDYVGGVVGRNSGTVENCTNTGAVTGTSEYADVGGVVGSNSGTVENCTNTGTVKGTGQYACVGGVVGSNYYGTVENCYFLEGTAQSGIGSGSGEATSKTAEEFASGEVTWLLNGSSTDGAWYQNLAEDRRDTNLFPLDLFPIDPYPVLDPTHLSVTKVNNDYTNTLATDAEGVYLIYSGPQLYAFAALVNGGEKSANGKLMNNITLSTVCGESIGDWTPIGRESNAFTGTFDGQGNTIADLYINNSNGYQGLFGYMGSGSTVKDVTVTGNVTGNNYVGGVVGRCVEGTVENCTSEVTVTGNSYVGGVVGHLYHGSQNCAVINCHNKGDVYGTENTGAYPGAYVGGVVGVVTHNGNGNGIVENCTNTGNVTGDGEYAYVAGVVGSVVKSATYSGTVTVKNCTNKGDVTGTGDKAIVAGVVGCIISTSNVENCSNTGGIKGGYYVGGVAGFVDGTSTVTDCYNKGDVMGATHVGGVAGFVHSGSTMMDCYNTGNIAGTSDTTKVGGVAGTNYTNSSVTNCYFLDTTADNGIGGSLGTSEKVESKTKDEFAGGEVAWLLQNGQETPVWGQNLDSDPTPVLMVFLSEDEVADYTVYRVAFVKSDEENTLVDTRYANPGGTVTLPDVPEGCFGWYVDVETNTEFTSDTTVTENLSVFTKIRKTTPDISIDYENEKLEGFENGATYTINGDSVTPENGTLSVEAYINTTISIVQKADSATSADSEPQELTLPARREISTTVGHTDETILGYGDGKITGLTNGETYQLSADGGTSWESKTADESGNITGLASGTY